MSEGADEAARQNGGRRADRSRDDKLNPQQQRALDKLRAEAKEHGVTLASGGKGGLDPSRVLGIFRRDVFADGARGGCKACGTKKDLTVHHKGGIVASAHLSKLGHRDVMSNYVVLCEKCHDKAHQEARKKGVDSSQITPVGDQGTKRDRGLPLAKPKR